MNDAATQALLSAVRSLLIVAGTILVTKGIVDDATMQSLVGALTTIITVAWGMWDKKRAEQAAREREVTAMNAGVTMGLSRPVTADEVPSIIAAAGPVADTKKGNP